MAIYITEFLKKITDKDSKIEDKFYNICQVFTSYNGFIHHYINDILNKRIIDFTKKRDSDIDSIYLELKEISKKVNTGIKQTNNASIKTLLSKILSLEKELFEMKKEFSIIKEDIKSNSFKKKDNPIQIFLNSIDINFLKDNKIKNIIYFILENIILCGDKDIVFNCFTEFNLTSMYNSDRKFKNLIDSCLVYRKVLSSNSNAELSYNKTTKTNDVKKVVFNV